MLNDPEFLKTREPTYVEFRQTIRDREAFNREDDKLKPTNQLKNWKSKKALDDDYRKTIMKLKKEEERKLD